MIVPPGSFSSIDSARRAVTKSPGTNSPVSSTKKQRSASPSKAMPRSARSFVTSETMKRRFSSSSGFGSWSGNEPSGSKKCRTASTGRRSRIGGSIDPAIPLAASMTTCRGFTAAGSMKDMTLSTKPG